MKVNVKLDLDDLGRSILADYIDETHSNRLATRKDVNRFVAGCLDAVLTAQFRAETTREDEIKRLRKLGYDDSYIRGWLQVAGPYT